MNRALVRSEKLIALALSAHSEILSAVHARAQFFGSRALNLALFKTFDVIFVYENYTSSTFWLRFKEFANLAENRLRFKEVHEIITIKYLNFIK